MRDHSAVSSSFLPRGFMVGNPPKAATHLLINSHNPVFSRVSGFLDGCIFSQVFVFSPSIGVKSGVNSGVELR